jgi:hypothetical protein
MSPSGQALKALELHRIIGKLPIIHEKKVLHSAGHLQKHFESLPLQQRIAVVNEWAGTTTFVVAVENVDPRIREEQRQFLYVSQDDEAGERDFRLWFPEFAN